MTREEAIFCEKSYIGETNCIDCKYYGTDTCKSRESHKMAIEALEQEPVLDKIRAEIEQKIEQERFARSVFRGEEKDAVKAEQCTGSIFAYNNVIKLIDKYKTEQEKA